MQSSRYQILELIKKQGKASIEELASAVGLSAMTVRQHLAILEREGHIISGEERRPLGRPRYIYSLSPRGEDQFPKSYALLAQRLLQELKEQEGEAKLTQVFEGMAERLATTQRPRLAGRPLPEQVALVADLLNNEGNLAEWVETETDYTILAYNCPYLRVAETHAQLCAFHLRFLGLLLEAPVRRGHCLMDGDTFCCYHVEKPAL